MISAQPDDDHTRFLSPREIARAWALYRSGWSIQAVAADCSLKISALQATLGLPQWHTSLQMDENQSRAGDD